MESCSKLKHVSISALKHLYLVDFSNCGALVGAGRYGYPNGEAMKTDKIDMELPAPKEASSLLDNFDPRVTFRLHKRFDLDLEALLQQQPVFRQLNFSCEEVPSYFTHKVTGTSSSLTIPLRQTSLSQPFFRLRAGAVIVYRHGSCRTHIQINCRFKDRLGNHFDSPIYQESITAYDRGPRGTHLLVFDYRFPLAEYNVHLAELNYDHVEIQLHFLGDNTYYELKEWGIRLLDDYLSAENKLGDPNTLSHVSEGDEDNMVIGIEHNEELGTLDSTPSPNNSSIFEDDVNKRNTDSENEEEHGRTSKRIKKV